MLIAKTVGSGTDSLLSLSLSALACTFEHFIHTFLNQHHRWERRRPFCGTTCNAHHAEQRLFSVDVTTHQPRAHIHNTTTLRPVITSNALHGPFVHSGRAQKDIASKSRIHTVVCPP